VTITDIFNRLTTAFPAAGLTLEENAPGGALCRVPAAALLDVALKLRDDPALHFEALMCLSGLDKGAELHTVYHLDSMLHHHQFALRVAVPKDSPQTPSLSAIWPTAEWHERESYDLLGIIYTGHPDPRRILCPDDWDGHPLRKDYKAPTEFHGISLTNNLPGLAS
jgi:NADH-quinone oxidoreductase subunit C